MNKGRKVRQKSGLEVYLSGMVRHLPDMLRIMGLTTHNKPTNTQQLNHDIIIHIFYLFLSPSFSAAPPHLYPPSLANSLEHRNQY